MILSLVPPFWVIQPGQELLSGINTHQHPPHNSRIYPSVAEVLSPGHELLRRILQLYEWHSIGTSVSWPVE